MRLADAEKELQTLHERNARVEVDKAWELSWTRRLWIGGATFVVAGVWLAVIEDTYPWFKALIPSVGYLLSTLSLPFIKRRWVRSRPDRREQ